MPVTYNHIATTRLTSSQQEINFNSIPQIYTDIILIANCTGVSSTGAAQSMRFNGDTGYNYNGIYMIDDAAGIAINDNRAIIGAVNGTFSTSFPFMTFVHIQNYTSSYYKSFISRGGYPDYEISITANTWRSTAPITSIMWGQYGTATMNVGTICSLYGIKKA